MNINDYNISTFEESAYINVKTRNNFLIILKLLAINSIKWKNLPETVDERFLNLILYNNGSILFFRDEIIGYLALPYSSQSNLNIYGIPKDRLAYALNGYQHKLSMKNSVIIYDNYMRTPYSSILYDYAMRLYEVQRSIDTNVKTQKFPLMILGDEQHLLSLKNLMMKYEGNEPFIYGNPHLPINSIKAINTQTPYVADKLQILKNQIWNEALTVLGIENSNQDKKERLVSDEVNSNYGSVEMYRKIRLNQLEQAVSQINNKFNLNIEVSFNSDLKTMLNFHEVIEYE